MARVEPTKPRFTVVDEPGGVRIIVPMKRRSPLILFALFFLGIWSLGIAAVVGNMHNPKGNGVQPAGLVVWVAVWAIPGILGLSILLWSLLGREVFVLGSGVLTVRKEIFGLGRSKEFDLAHVRDIRASPEAFNPWNPSSSMVMWTGSRTIAFDYGAKTYRFGTGLEEAEAKMVVAEIRKRANLPPA